MIHPDYDSPGSLKTFLEEKGMAMQKKFGQNFLINRQARVKLIDALDINSSSFVWEVGPGLGAMTEEILQRDAHVTVFEIDRGFAACVSDFFSDYEKQGKFALVPGDVLKTWEEVAKKKIPDRFFGNLPYNIAAIIIADMIEAEVRFEKAVVTVQKEVAQRMCAKPGDKDYSSFSVLCAWAYDVKPLMDLGGGNFWPRPNVDSRAVIMTKKEVFPRCKSPEHFQKILRSLFSSRRKTVKNNLTAFYNDGNRAETILDAAGIDPQIRAEKLSLEQLLHLSDVSYSNIIEDHE